MREAADPHLLEIEFRSDWRIGTGTRTATVDSLVARDGDELPRVPAKTVAGIWRDGCEMAARALDAELSEKSWTSWLEYLFGKETGVAGQSPKQDEGNAYDPPIPAALMPSAARFSEAIRQRLRVPQPSEDVAALRSAFTFIKPGVKIDDVSGRAQDDFLRFEEVSRAGAVLRGPFWLRDDLKPSQQQVALALLAAGAGLVERMGGSRRRGLGRCRWRILQPSGTELAPAAALEALPPDPGQRPHVDVIRATSAAVPEPAGEWVEYDLRLELIDPVVITAQVAGNVVESLDQIPGAALLRWFATEARRRGVDASPWIREGLIRVLPATLEVDGERGLPVPLAFHRVKGTEDVLNRLVVMPADGEQLKQIRGGYVAEGARTPASLHSARLSSHTKNTIEDKSQRPTSAVGGVYTYQAVPEGTVLHSRLILDRALAELVPGGAETLSGETRLGRSRKDDFGRTYIHVRPRPAGDVVTAAPLPIVREFTVWLETDVLLRGPSGGWSTSVDDLIDAIGERVGTGLRRKKDAPLFVRLRRHEGFQSVWNLPKPSLVAFRAGSCFTVQTVDEGGAEIGDLVDGIGERPAEGFGRIRLRDPLLDFTRGTLADAPEPATDKATHPSNPTIPLSEEDGKFAEVVERAAWREWIWRRAEEVTAEAPVRSSLLGFTAQIPTSSQIGGLRSATLGIRRFSDADSARTWLASLHERKKNFFDPIAALLARPEAVWEELERGGAPPAPLLTGRDRSVLREELWGEAVRAVILTAARARQIGLDVPFTAHTEEVLHAGS
jgi:CRISPR-associated protein Csx10